MTTRPDSPDSSFVRLEGDGEDWQRRKNKVSQWNRHRKWNRFLTAIAPGPGTSILDVGFSNEEYQVTDNFIEKHYQWPAQITALGVEEPTLFSQRYPDIKVVTYDGVTFPFEDKSFDVVWSNAVVEHVGDRAAQVKFLSEIARTGKRAFVTTPNRFFPVEVHSRTPLLHYLPKPVFDRYLKIIGKEWAAGDYMRLIGPRELRRLLADAGVTNFTIIRNRFAGFTLDFVVVIG